MTLTHARDNNWADSSSDTPTHNGLTDFGKEVVREMNRLGMIVDLAHVSDKTFYDALAVTTKPVIVSHSSMRAISNVPRNVTDDMLRALARNGGVIGINFGMGFINPKDAMLGWCATVVNRPQSPVVVQFEIHRASNRFRPVGNLYACQRNEQKPIKDSERLINSKRSPPTVRRRIRGKKHARTSAKPLCGSWKKLLTITEHRSSGCCLPAC